MPINKPKFQKCLQEAEKAWREYQAERQYDSDKYHTDAEFMIALTLYLKNEQ